ncbi:MAG: flagellar protein FlgN [Pseudomonadota bacterium]
MTPSKTRRDALIGVIESLHAEIAALKSNDVDALERATQAKLAGINALADFGIAPTGPELRALAEEANRLNETCRIYVNLMAANVRRRLQSLTGDAGTGYRPGMGIAAYA